MRPSPARGCGFRGGRGRRDAPPPGDCALLPGVVPAKRLNRTAGTPPGDRAVHVLWKRPLARGGLACVQKGGPGKGLLVIIKTQLYLRDRMCH